MRFRLPRTPASCKFQFTSTKLQTNFKFQYPNSKACYLKIVFWRLLGIWNLVLGILPEQYHLLHIPKFTRTDLVVINAAG